MKKKVSELAPNVLLESTEITVKKDSNRKRLLIFLAIGLVAAIALFGFLFMDKIIAIFDKHDVVEEKEEEVINDVKNTLHIYRTPHNDVDTFIYNDEELAEAQSDNTFSYYPDIEEVGVYNCENYDCEGHPVYSYDYGSIDSIFIEEDYKYYLYNYVTKTKEALPISGDYSGAEILSYGKKVYGILFSDYGMKIGTYYSLESKETYDFANSFDSYYRVGSSYVVDKDGYFLFNIINNTFTELPFSNDDYDYVNLVLYNDELYGYSLHLKDYKYDTAESYAFYSTKDKKITIRNLSSRIYGGPELLDNNIIIDNKLYNYSTGELVHYFRADFKTNEENDCEDAYTTNAIGNDEGIYYFLNTDCLDGGYGHLLDRNFNSLLSGKEYDSVHLGVAINGNLIVNNVNNEGESTTFSIYSESGTLISNSKTYKEVLGVYESYIVVVDTDNYLKLVNSDGSVAAKFIKWNSKMGLHTWLSGYYEYKGIKGIYLVVEDNSILPNDDFEGGYGYEYYYDVENKTTGKIAVEIGAYAKPVLYLYPTKKTNITVTFTNPKMLTTTYPKYNGSWQVVAYPNGDLYDKSNNYYYALYWEEIKNHEVDFKEGFYVTKENAISFLEEKLTIIGLNAKERNEFIMYWLPVLENNGKSLVYFELTEERDAYSKIIINPKPDSLLRVAIHVKKVTKKANIKGQELATFKRTGFTAVEWGGVEH